MYYSIIKNSYIALLFLSGSYCLTILLMVLSDAQPVQFWPIECDTFNQHVSDGVHHKCFCQPFNCDDPIVIQGYVLAEGSPPSPDEYSISIRRDDNSVILSVPFVVTTLDDRYVYTATITPEESSPDLCESMVKLVIVNDTEEEEIAKSDCLDIQTEHKNTILITYFNHRNFAGLVYEDVSPSVEFALRAPAIFYHQRFPEEDETMELSSSLVQLNGNIKRQRMLDVDYVPYYFHEKLKLILKHQFVTIYNKEWVKEEAYEISEGERRWPVKKAKCWISEKEFVHRNVL